MSVKIKICGITNENDAVSATNLGAHYLGFNFSSQSPRKVSVGLAAEILKKLPPFVTPVGVFVEQGAEEIVKIAQKTGLMGVQLHGEQTPEDCRFIRERLELSVVCRAFRAAQASDLEPAAAFQNCCTHFLIDARVEGEAGGTGQTFPWELAENLRGYKVPYFVAGGLTPENVAEAIEKTQPFGVDTASGVERSQKRKDYDRMKAFIEAVRDA